METQLSLPEVTRKRMVQLLQLLKAWPDNKITSSDISTATGWKDTLIRHDFWLLGANLKGVSNGYFVKDLQTTINQKLNLEPVTTEIQKKNCCVVGLGRLGAALLDENLIDGNLFSIKAGFDSNVYRVEILRSTYPLYPASEMEWIIKREKIEYAILATQDAGAQQMCNHLVKAGIKGIVNMTNVMLTVPEDITPDGVKPNSVKIENLSVINALKLVI